MKTEREFFEELQNKSVLKRLAFIDPLNMYLTRDEYSDDDLTIHYCLEINHGWKMWQASVQRDGYKIVPVEPTIAMVRAYYETPKPTASRCYQAMIGAAP